MAQSNQSTDLALAGGGIDQSEDNEQQEQKSGYLSALNGVDVLRQVTLIIACLLYTSPSPRDVEESRMPSSA